MLRSRFTKLPQAFVENLFSAQKVLAYFFDWSQGVMFS
jgi:hypothetical protein